MLSLHGLRTVCTSSFHYTQYFPVLSNKCPAWGWGMSPRILYRHSTKTRAPSLHCRLGSVTKTREKERWGHNSQLYKTEYNQLNSSCLRNWKEHLGKENAQLPTEIAISYLINNVLLFPNSSGFNRVNNTFNCSKTPSWAKHPSISLRTGKNSKQTKVLVGQSTHSGGNQLQASCPLNPTKIDVFIP